MLIFHEGKACDAVLRELERKSGAKRTDVSSPEVTKAGPPVELIFKLNGELFAMEHTGIEPFEGHVRLNAQAENHFGPIGAALEGALPPDTFELHIPAKAMQDFKKPAIAKIQAAIVAWVTEAGPGLTQKRYADYRGAAPAVQVEGVPFEMRLFRFEALAGPRFQIRHSMDGNQEQARAERIARSCDDKCPKLKDWKEKGARTVLVLEDNDIQLTNAPRVTDAFLKAVGDRQFAPDETYLVASCMEPWHVWPICLDGKSYYDLAETSEAQGWDIDEAALNSITAR